VTGTYRTTSNGMMAFGLAALDTVNVTSARQFRPVLAGTVDANDTVTRDDWNATPDARAAVSGRTSAIVVELMLLTVTTWPPVSSDPPSR
jgi:hypothetical protein